jgi:hypothetical protein
MIDATYVPEINQYRVDIDGYTHLLAPDQAERLAAQLKAALIRGTVVTDRPAPRTPRKAQP